MPAYTRSFDWSVTEEKVADAVRRIVEATQPLQIIAFGSRARGDHRPESDLDLAVILDSEESNVSPDPAYEAIQEVDMSIDLIVASRAKYELFRPYFGSIYNYISEEGVKIYDREDPEHASPHALYDRGRGRVDSQVPVA